MFKFENIEIIEIEDSMAVTVTLNGTELTEWIEIEDGVVTIEMVDSNMCMNQQGELDALGIEDVTELMMAMKEAAQNLLS
ncbi:hypothetical protein P3547_19800 [Vibrio parahaemolyticus]|nr:hypothetical protein [Vibrio parahaemolyticus]